MVQSPHLELTKIMFNTSMSFATKARSLLRESHAFRISHFNHQSIRKIHNVPFQDDLTPVDEDLFNLQGFQEYKEAPDVVALKKELGIIDGNVHNKLKAKSKPSKQTDTKLPLSESVSASVNTFQEHCLAKEPVVFVSQLQNPYLNLAIEDYIFNSMSVPQKLDSNFNRLMFYVNSPCVVIGKNQNPWKEVNIPLLTDLKLPLVRRRSGGGSVVHDLGNVNYSFMTSRDQFDRFTFANLVTKAVNYLASEEKKVIVNSRGDIITERDEKKVSGSAYKIARGKSYHHGTMLLNLRLDILRQLLHRDESKLGFIHTAAAVASVKSLVTNLNVNSVDFIESVTKEFQDLYGVPEKQLEESDQDKFELDQTELLGLSDFVDAFSQKTCKVFKIDETCELPEEIYKTKEELMKWEWRFGATPKFLHHLNNAEIGVDVTIEVGPKAEILSIKIGGPEKALQSFKFLEEAISKGRSIAYTGSNVAGYVLDDELSDWIGEAIDGTS